LFKIIRERTFVKSFFRRQKIFWESVAAEINTTVITLEKIARALCVPLAELFQFEEDDPEKANAEQLLRKLIEGRDIDEITFIADVSRFILSKLQGKSYPHPT